MMASPAIPNPYFFTGDNQTPFINWDKVKEMINHVPVKVCAASLVIFQELCVYMVCIIEYCLAGCTNVHGVILHTWHELNALWDGTGQFVLWKWLETQILRLSRMSDGHYSMIVAGAIVLTFILLCIMLKHWSSVKKPKRTFRNAMTDDKAMQYLFDIAKTAYEPGHTEIIVKEVMSKKIYINYVDPSNGLSLFLCACLSGQRKLVKFLLCKGADVNAQTPRKDTVLYLATYGVLNSPHADITLLEDLIGAGCDVNAQNDKGYTPLHRAASKGNEDVIKCLLLNGADPYITNKSGIYPIDSATNAGYVTAAKLLKIKLGNGHVWDTVEPHTPSKVRLGLKSPNKTQLLESLLPSSNHSKKEILSL